VDRVEQMIDKRDGPAGQDVRIERDSMGQVAVPAQAKYRAQTQRAVDNFPVSGQRIDRQLIGAIASIKGTSARLRGEAGRLDPAKATAIHDSAAEVARGDWDAHFPIDVFQTGSGTSSNMNANEVIATLAAERLGTTRSPPTTNSRRRSTSRRPAPSCEY
jgi:fumarate hydratase class II